MEAATGGLDFVLGRMRSGDRLLHAWKDGEARIGGFLEDYGAIGNALLSTHEATLDPRWLEEARWCADRVVELFHDAEAGVFYDTAADAEPLVVRPRDTMDSATPSGTSLAVELLLRAAHVFSDVELERVGSRALEAEGKVALSHPAAFGRLLSVATRRLMPPLEVAIVGPPDAPETAALVEAALRPWLPQRAVVGGAEGDSARDVPLLEGRGMRGGRPTAFVCSGYACREPVGDARGVAEQLEGILAEGGAPR